jgi:methyltransferase (TIGR00027 family)
MSLERFASASTTDATRSPSEGRGDMRQGRASRTAEQNALFRALESARPAKERLFDDSLARAFLSASYALVERVASVPGPRGLVAWIIDRRWPGVRTSVVARTRLIDEAIGGVVDARTEQLVILGAGFDTRAYRLAPLRRLAVFEVDHPDTQARKRAILERVIGALPPHVHFIGIDFTRESLDRVMPRTAFRPSAPSCILWEGVSNYLNEAAVDATLRWCAQAPVGTPVLFTYVHRDILTRPEAFVGSSRLFAALERAGERFTFGLDPAELPAYLAARGLALEQDIGAAEYRRRYYGDASRHMRGHEFYRVVVARVAPRPSG